MSILSAPQVRPVHLWSALRFLGASKIVPDDAEMAVWFGGADTALIRSVREAGQGLGFLERENARWRPRHGVPKDWVEFGDRLHAAFVAESAGAEFIKPFAIIVVVTELMGFARLCGGKKTFAEEVIAPEAKGFVTFNDARLSSFTDWTEAAGMCVPPMGPVVYQPLPAARLDRELRTAFQPGEVVSVAKLTSLVAEKLPYLDGGVTYHAAMEHVSHREGGRNLPRISEFHLTGVLSNTLRQLERRGRVRLHHSGGDALADKRIVCHGAHAQHQGALARQIRALSIDAPQSESLRDLRSAEAHIVFTHLTLT